MLDLGASGGPPVLLVPGIGIPSPPPKAVEGVPSFFSATAVSRAFLQNAEKDLSATTDQWSSEGLVKAILVGPPCKRLGPAASSSSSVGGIQWLSHQTEPHSTVNRWGSITKTCGLIPGRERVTPCRPKALKLVAAQESSLSALLSSSMGSRNRG